MRLSGGAVRGERRPSAGSRTLHASSTTSAAPVGATSPSSPTDSGIRSRTPKSSRYYESFDPPDPYAAIRLGRIYEELGERDKAREEYEEVLAVFVDPDPELRAMVAEAREALGRLGFRPRG